ncbi:collagenase-like [Armigeres subalbatus]|uniref:collagenase-like n=1 Tax=Armigeres subalbatus TaxID=124917 RepID=UPI002ED6B325
MKHFTLAAVILYVLGAQAAPDRTPRIIEGNIALHQPYNAYILYLNQNNAGFFSGGSIISNRHILTSARNIVGFVRWNVGLGSNVFVELSYIVSTEAIAHPLFDRDTWLNDIGIIVLPVSLVFTIHINPVALPQLSESMLPYVNEEGSIVGFGFTDGSSTTHANVLHRAFQRVITDARCQARYPVTAPEHFCAEDTAGSSNVCNGDIGAGFITELRGVPILTGIATLITENCGNSYPTGYTRVASFRSWIYSVAQI